ncbi:MAG: MBL fold metallo-hydrolase [Eubacterium sp.]|jgi:glyoxylase-like metal-dependent hydrolase (beta-lactamase superfamily II)|nr:MBL fold metallo-hydrolase [Eubacterium sp.]
MKICENVHQIKISFNVTPEIKRFVYVYLITGKYCYLIDAGVAGSERIISSYMEGLGRSLSEIKAVLLTHAHPDHMGGAAKIKRMSGCEIYVSNIEKAWIENIDLQFQERPIPNFYSLVNEPVEVEQIVKQDNVLTLEPDISFRVLDTPGHSKGSVSYVYEEGEVVFCGDAIPVVDDFPIFVDLKESERSIEKIKRLSDVSYCCPAWDRVYYKEEIDEIAEGSLEMLRKLRGYVNKVKGQGGKVSEEEMKQISEFMGWREIEGNPLFRKSIENVFFEEYNK